MAWGADPSGTFCSAYSVSAEGLSLGGAPKAEAATVRPAWGPEDTQPPLLEQGAPGLAGRRPSTSSAEPG